MLCVAQRVPYFLAGCMALLALVLPVGVGDRALIVSICGLLFVIGAGIAFYHFGVEQHWWVSAGACGITANPQPEPLTTEELMARLQQPAAKPCDVADFTILGISATVYNTAAFLALAMLAFKGAGRMRRQG